MNTNSAVQVSLGGTTTVSEDSPLSFSTVQLYVPTMSLQPTDGSMVITKSQAILYSVGLFESEITFLLVTTDIHISMAEPTDGSSESSPTLWL